MVKFKIGYLASCVHSNAYYQSKGLDPAVQNSSTVSQHKQKNAVSVASVLTVKLRLLLDSS
jgi:hypothetical protein